MYFSKNDLYFLTCKFLEVGYSSTDLASQTQDADRLAGHLTKFVTCNNIFLVFALCNYNIDQVIKSHSVKCIFKIRLKLIFKLINIKLLKLTHKN